MPSTVVVSVCWMLPMIACSMSLAILGNHVFLKVSSSVLARARADSMASGT